MAQFKRPTSNLVKVSMSQNRKFHRKIAPLDHQTRSGLRVVSSMFGLKLVLVSHDTQVREHQELELLTEYEGLGSKFRYSQRQAMVETQWRDHKVSSK